MITRQSLILLFALAFALLIAGLPLLGQPFPGYPLMDWADVLDIATPLVLMPLYWLLFTDAGRVYRTLYLALAFAVLAALWAEGQGMHLSANSIGNLFGGGTTEVHTLIHFYDEVLSHYLWHLGIIGLSILLLAVPYGARVCGSPKVGDHHSVIRAVWIHLLCRDRRRRHGAPGTPSSRPYCGLVTRSEEKCHQGAELGRVFLPGLRDCTAPLCGVVCAVGRIPRVQRGWSHLVRSRQCARRLADADPTGCVVIGACLARRRAVATLDERQFAFCPEVDSPHLARWSTAATGAGYRTGACWGPGTGKPWVGSSSTIETRSA